MIKVREKTISLLDAASDGVIDKDILIRDLLMFLSESDVEVFIDIYNYDELFEPSVNSEPFIMKIKEL